jgi:hypothetical protein
MKKLIFLPMLLASIFYLSHAREMTKEKDVSFKAFLAFFPEEKLPFKVTLKQMTKTAIKNPETWQNSVEAANINLFFDKFILHPERFDTTGERIPERYDTTGERITYIGERGFHVNSPVAQMQMRDYHIVVYSRNYMGLSRNSRYFLSVLDKEGKLILTEKFAAYLGGSATEATLNEQFNIEKNTYLNEKKDNNRKNFVLTSSTQTSLIKLMNQNMESRVDVNKYEENKSR